MPFLGIRNIEKKAYLEEIKRNNVAKVMSLRYLWIARESFLIGDWIKRSGAQEIDFARSCRFESSHYHVDHT